MQSYRYVLIGGGMAAAAAVAGIRRVDPDGSIGLFSADRYPPYARPPLSKALWTDEGQFERVWLTERALVGNLEEHLTCPIVSIDARRRVIVTETGTEYGYDKLLLATGGSPVRISAWPSSVVYFRTVDDYLAVWRAAQRGADITLVGGGFIGAELATALCRRHVRVTMVFPERGILGRLLPPHLSRQLTERYRQEGVQVLAEESVRRITFSGARFHIETAQGSRWEADLVVAGLGIRPNLDLAVSAGVETDSYGIVVDNRGRTSLPDIYAAGDCVSIAVSDGSRRTRVEHEDNAVTRGDIAGVNMAGGDAEATKLPFFYSDVLDAGFEAVGDLDATLPVVERWRGDGEAGVVYYLRDGHTVGVLNWNVWGGVDSARDLIRRGATADELPDSV